MTHYQLLCNGVFRIEQHGTDGDNSLGASFLLLGFYRDELMLNGKVKTWSS
jgi:hypothetical protein